MMIIIIKIISCSLCAGTTPTRPITEKCGNTKKIHKYKLQQNTHSKEGIKKLYVKIAA
jgi:hypothetical protein